MKIKTEHFLFVLGVVGLVIGFLPLYIVNGVCTVTLLSYCQGAVSVYIDMFEKLRLAYIPLFFVSVTSIVATLPVFIPRLKDVYALHIDIVFMLSLAFVFAEIPLVLIMRGISSVSYAYAISDAIIYVQMTIEKTPACYIVLVGNVSPLLVASIVFLAYNLVEIVGKSLLHPGTSSEK